MSGNTFLDTLQALVIIWLVFIVIRSIWRRAARRADIRRGIRAADRERRRQEEIEARRIEKSKEDK